MLFGVAVVISPSVFIAVSCSVLWVYHNLSGSVIPPLLSSSRVSYPFAFPCFPGGSAGKESACNVRDEGLTPGGGKVPWRRERLPALVFWPGELHGLYSPRGRKELDTTERLSLSQQFHLLFHTHCRISLEVSTKVLWEIYWHFIVPMGQFVKNWHLI